MLTTWQYLENIKSTLKCFLIVENKFLKLMIKVIQDEREC